MSKIGEGYQVHWGSIWGPISIYEGLPLYHRVSTWEMSHGQDLLQGDHGGITLESLSKKVLLGFRTRRFDPGSDGVCATTMRRM